VSVVERSWTGRVRERAVGALPPERLLPDRQLSYVSAWTTRDIPRRIPVYRLIWRNHYGAQPPLAARAPA
jgi:hypothetical protein